MTNDELIKKAKSLFKEKSIIKMISANGEYSYTNALYKLKLELDCWCDDENYRIVDVQ